MHKCGLFKQDSSVEDVKLTAFFLLTFKDFTRIVCYSVARIIEGIRLLCATVDKIGDEVLISIILERQNSEQIRRLKKPHFWSKDEWLLQVCFQSERDQIECSINAIVDFCHCFEPTAVQVFFMTHLGILVLPSAADLTDSELRGTCLIGHKDSVESIIKFVQLDEYILKLTCAFGIKCVGASCSEIAIYDFVGIIGIISDANVVDCDCVCHYGLLLSLSKFLSR